MGQMQGALQELLQLQRAAMPAAQTATPDGELHEHVSLTTSAWRLSSPANICCKRLSYTTSHARLADPLQPHARSGGTLDHTSDT